MNEYLSGLNPAQTEAVLHIDGPLLIFAGAGSGKTRVLTYRVAHLLQQGIDPYHVIAITFTNKAAKEMRERINAITPIGEQVWVSTFHSACTQILRREIHALGFGRGFSIYDQQDSTRLLKDILKEKRLDSEYYKPNYVAHIISTQKNELRTPLEYEQLVSGLFRESNVADVYATYQERLQLMNAMDFDDIIMKTVELLQNNEKIREKYQNRFRYVMVDEYQDTNHAQYKLVNLLAGYASNLCVVGDDDQSIYGWRGANVENILQFERDYAGAKIVKLEENYRSTQTILDAANDVICNNENRADKRLWTENGVGSRIRVYTARDEKDEGSFIARTIKEQVANGEAEYKDFAILYRTNAQSRAIETAFSPAKIPYRIFGGVRFYERMEVKDILAYLKAINNPADDVAHLRIINVPKRGIGNASIEKVQKYALENNMTFSLAIERAADVPGLGRKASAVADFARYMLELSRFADSHTVAATIKKILADTRYMDQFADDEIPENQERVANLLELIANANAFELESDDKSLGKYLEDVALVTDVDNYDTAANSVSLMTMHSAKGLEFNAVFVVGMEENIFPSYRSLESGDITAIEEERRLCYVGFTRARQQLYVTHAELRTQYDFPARNAPSRFLGEVRLDRLTPVNTYGRPKEFRQSKAATQMERRVKPSIPLPAPKKIALDFEVGDMVRPAKAMARFGVGKVLEIRPAGADYEVTIEFESGKKKFMAKLGGVEKVDA